MRAIAFSLEFRGLAGARGRIVSSFLVSETGGLTDRRLGVLFVDP
jgi:hypothetical protein